MYLSTLEYLPAYIDMKVSALKTLLLRIHKLEATDKQGWPSHFEISIVVRNLTRPKIRRIWSLAT